MQTAEVFSKLRSMSGGKLTQEQVNAGDKIIASVGIDVFADLLGVSGGGGNRDISSNGYAIIKESEGLRLQSYLDTGGVWTIGYGTIKYPSGVMVKKGDVITQAQAEQYLMNDSKWVDSALDKYIKVPVTQNQFDALASFVYNIGETAFKTSTLLVKLNAGDYVGAANQLDRWVNDNGKKIQGLVNRRAKEKALFLRG